MIRQLCHLVMFSSVKIQKKLVKFDTERLKSKYFSCNIVTESHRDKIPQHLLYPNTIESQNWPKMTLVMFYSHGLIYCSYYVVIFCF